MKKWLKGLALATSVLALTACGDKDAASDKLIVGATAVPHAEILEAAKPILEEKGIDLEIVVFTDYVTPNITLRDEEIDANYFQTPGYLEGQMNEYKDFDFVSVGAIHHEPLGLYSKKYKSLEELPEGATILMSNSFSDHGRILPIFENAGLIKLKDGVGNSATVDDIVENPKNLQFSYDIEAKMLPIAFNNDEADVVAINTNYALEGEVDIEKYGFAFEDRDIVPANLVVVKEKNKDNENIKTLVEVLRSEEIHDFINKKYNQAVMPAK